MSDIDIRRALERHWSNLEHLTHLENQEVVHEIYHPDLVLDFPQSGESMIGLANVKAMRTAYPANVTFKVNRMRGSGDLWVSEVEVTYDGATTLYATNIMEFRSGKVVRETIYFGEPFEAPSWRAPWVEMTR